MDDSKIHRRGGAHRRATSTTTSWCPSSIVCRDTPSSKSNAVEWGLVLSVGVLCLFGVGCYETMASLPEPPTLPLSGATLHPTISSQQQQRTLSAATTAAATSKDQEQQQEQPPKNQQQLVTPFPHAQWPVSTRNETEFDSIIHPGDKTTLMKVPKFWSYPVHHNQLMPRSTAVAMGSCANNPSINGEDCPLHQRTIFVAIASYRDFQCRQTVASIFSRAAHPERIRVGVVDQLSTADGDPLCNAPLEGDCTSHPDQPLCKYAKQIDVYEMEARLSIGPVFARHIGYRQYRGEYYATQSDAHVSYTQNWDQDIIEQWVSTGNEMAVLSTYLTDVQGSISPDGHSLRHTRPIMCNTAYEGGAQGLHLRHLSQPERFPSIKGVPQLSPWWAAGYSFSRGHFLVNVPYDWISQMIFQGEEMSIGIRGFTVGYDFYAPERSVCFHHYAVGNNAAVRNKVHHFWENDRKYSGTGKKAMQRLLGLVHMNPEVPSESWDHTEEAIYGIGGVRTPEKFYKTFGIDVVKKEMQKNLCSFVEKGQMHRQFTPHLRKDGMGIEYGDISYQFKTPPGQ